MALILREIKGSKLTISEMDNNLLYLEGLSGNTYATYQELNNLIGGSDLIPGNIYLLSDYETTYIQPVTNIQTSSGVIEPLILTANSTNSFDQICSSELYPQDVIYYDFNDNTEGFTKGKIYRRDIPVRNIEIESDWRHIKYRRWKINVTTQWVSGGTYTKNQVLTDPTGVHVYIVPYNITGSTDIDELIRYPHKNGDYGSYLSTGQPVCVGSEIGNEATVPVSTDYLDLPLIQEYYSIQFISPPEPVIMYIDTVKISTHPYTSITTNFKKHTLHNVVVQCYIQNSSFINVMNCSFGNSSNSYQNMITFSNIFSCMNSVFGNIHYSQINLSNNLTIGNLTYSNIGTRSSGLLAGHYKTTANVNGQQNQFIDIKDHSYGWIIGNGTQNVNISYKSKTGIIGTNCASISVGSFTNGLKILPNNTNWNIGSQLTMTNKTLPVLSNTYAKNVSQAGTKIACTYIDDTLTQTIIEV